MKTALLIWRTSLRSTSNTLRRDSRMRIAWVLGLCAQIALGIWSITRLVPLFASWQAAGPQTLQQHLWLTCLTAWLPLGLFAVLTIMSTGLNSQEALLLATQPIAPATRTRALYGLLVLGGIANWLLFEGCVLGLALASVLGWSALPWLLLLVVGALLMGWLALLATLLTLRFLLPRARRLLLAGALPALLGLVLMLIAYLRGWRPVMPVSLPTWIPVPIFALLVLLALLLALWPLAEPMGRLYLTVLQLTQGRDRAARARVLPGVGLLLTLLRRSRTLTAALLVKGLLNQGRSSFTWMRLLVIAAGIALFPFVRAFLTARQIAPTLQVGGAASFLAFLLLFEYAPYAISSEGNRLALYLVIPRGISSFVRAAGLVSGARTAG